MTIRIAQPAPDFTATAVIDGAFGDITLSDHRGRYVVLFFWPLDFTFVCPTEVLAFSDAVDSFADRDAQVLGVSVDSPYTHLAWSRTPRAEGGVAGVRFPMVSDLTRQIARSFEVLLDDEGVAARALFLIDREGIVRHASVNDLAVGRSVPEALRLLDALRHHEIHGEVCPAGWQPGEAAIVPEPERARGYFELMSG